MMLAYVAYSKPVVSLRQINSAQENQCWLTGVPSELKTLYTSILVDILCGQ
jgi:hypothetical protein